jgi:rhodanese-related sulfurtransferase
MKIMKTITSVLAALILAASHRAAAPEYRKITPAEAMGIMQSNGAYILLDVRTEEEYAEKHIEGAILIPEFELGRRAASELPDKDALILVYCRSGQRSESAARTLASLGYTQVYDFGGILDWPFETVS